MSEYQSIANVLFKFANSFDLKNWQDLENLMMDEVDCDYQDLRGQSGVYSKEEYVNLRKQSLDHLKTHHLFSNLEIVSQEKQAFCKVSAIIYRKDMKGICFNSHVIYDFELMQLSTANWKIKKIKQLVLWNEGDASIHKGIVTES